MIIIFLDGTVRGWSPISPASVIGQWQAVRLGVVEGDRVSKDERGEAPWFGVDEDNEAAAAVGELNESNESSSTSADDEDREDVSS